MEKYFVSYETAFLLKEMGINIPSIAYYSNHDNSADCGCEPRDVKKLEMILYVRDVSENELAANAPLYQQVSDWLKDTHGINIIEMPTTQENGDLLWEWRICTGNGFVNDIYYPTQKEAIDDMIKSI